jgi:DNA-binding transcriptional LysR family regulator
MVTHLKMRWMDPTLGKQIVLEIMTVILLLTVSVLIDVSNVVDVSPNLFKATAQSVEGGPWMSIYDHLEFKHFKYIVAIAEEGTFTAAAIRLPLAQSALSRQISDMEDALGVQIFDRSRGGSTLTDAGESLLRFARELLQTRVEIVNAIQAIQQASLHPFRIGFTPFVDQHIIGAVCSAYREIFPRALVAPQNGDTADLIERLKARELDAALVTLPLTADGFVVRPIMHESLVVCIRKDDPLADQLLLSPGDLNGRLGIFSDPRHHPPAHVRLLEMLAEQGIKPRMFKPTFNAQHVQWMVREDLCVALIREGEPVHEELTTRSIQGVLWTVDSAIVYQPEDQQRTLPLLIHELGKRLSVPGQILNKRPSVMQKKSRQETLFSNDAEERIG